MGTDMDKLKSRKFWVALLSAGALIAQGLYQEAAAVIIAYLASQGYADGQKERAKELTQAEPITAKVKAVAEPANTED